MNSIDKKSAKAISGSEWVGPQGGGGTCSFNAGDMVIGNLACAGPSSCAFNTQKISMALRTCSGDASCNENTAQLEVVGENGCKGDGSCSQNGPGDASSLEEPMVVRVQVNACQGGGACRNGEGNALLLGCNGENSCQDWNVPYTTGANVFQLGGVTFSVAQDSCSGANSCQNLAAGDTGFSIGSQSCTGANACRDINVDGNFTIGDNACTGDNSCQSCTQDVPDGAEDCGDGDGGNNGSGGDDSGSSSNGGDSQEGNSGSDAMSGRIFVAVFMLVVGLITL